MKKTILYPIVFIVIIILLKILYDVFDVRNSPEKITNEFLNLYPKEESLEYLSSNDLISLKNSRYTIDQIIKLDFKDFPIKIISTVALSDKITKVDIKNLENITSLTFKKDDSKWSLFFDLDAKIKILQEKEKLVEAESLEDEHLILMSLQTLRILEETDFYDERISKIEQLIRDKKFKNEYFKNIIVENIVVKNGFVTAIVKNIGNKSIKSIMGKIQLTSDSGEVIKEFSVSLYEYVPGSFAFGEPIQSKHQKKIAFNLEKLEMKNNKVFISVEDFLFYE